MRITIGSGKSRNSLSFPTGTGWEKKDSLVVVGILERAGVVFTKSKE